MQPDDRRAALIMATRSLLYVHGRDVTTRQIAEAAGVAEGTIFRVFGSKDELVDAAIAEAFRPGELPVRVRAIDPALPLEQKLVAYVSALQQRYLAIFGLMAAVGMMSPPDHDHEEHEAQPARAARHAGRAARARRRTCCAAGRRGRAPGQPADLQRQPPGISDGRPLTPEQIVDALLHGVLLEEN